MSMIVKGGTVTGESATTEPGSTTSRLAMAAILTYWALSLTAVIVNPQWNPLTRQLSEYALGHYGWLQIAAFLAWATACGFVAAALRWCAGGRGGRIGLVILCYCALGSVGVGAFLTDPVTALPDGLTVHGTLHAAFGVTSLVLLPAAALLITRSLAARHPASSQEQRVLRGIAFLPLAGLVLIWVPEAVGLIPVRGWPDRVLFLIYSLWLLKLATRGAALGKRHAGALSSR